MTISNTRVWRLVDKQGQEYLVFAGRMSRAVELVEDDLRAQGMRTEPVEVTEVRARVLTEDGQ